MNNKITDIRAKRVLIANILFRSGTLVSQIFLNIFLFKTTNDIQIVALFNIFTFIVQLLSFTFFARIVIHGYRNLTHLISLFGLTIVYLFIVSLGTNIVNYYEFIAIFVGFFSGMYWIGYNNNEFDFTNTSNRGNYLGLKKSLNIINAIFVPSLIGLIIGINYKGLGYEIAFGFSILFFILSGLIGMVNVEYNQKKKFSILSASKKIFTNNNLRKIVGNYSLLGFGLSNPLLNTILPVLLFSYGISEQNLGFLISTFSALTIIFSYLFGKFVGYEKYKITYILSVLLYILAVIVLIFFPNYLYVILFSSIITLLFTFIDIPQNVYSANLFHEIKGYKEIKGEYMVIREWPLMFGRISSFICIYFIGSFDVIGIKILFIIMAIVMFFSGNLFFSLKIKH